MKNFKIPTTPLLPQIKRNSMKKSAQMMWAGYVAGMGRGDGHIGEVREHFLKT